MCFENVEREYSPDRAYRAFYAGFPAWMFLIAIVHGLFMRLDIQLKYKTMSLFIKSRSPSKRIRYYLAMILMTGSLGVFSDDMVIGGPLNGEILPGSEGGMVIGGPLNGSILPGSDGGMAIGGPLNGSIMPGSEGGMIIGGPLNGSILPGSEGGMAIGGPLNGSIMPGSEGGMVIGGPLNGSILPPD